MIKSEYLKMSLLEGSHFWFVGKRLFIKTYLDIIKNNIHKVLDIGSGTGGTTEFLTNYGEVTGVEKSSYARLLSKKRNLKIVIGEAEKLPFKDRSFDLVTIFDVLYHREVKNINKALKEAFRVLKPHGYLLITDSALGWLNSQHDKVMFGKRRFTLVELNNLLKDEDFLIIKSSYIYFFTFPLVFIKRKIVDKYNKVDQSDVSRVPLFINWTLIYILKLEAILLCFISFPVGSSIIILATKK